MFLSKKTIKQKNDGCSLLFPAKGPLFRETQNFRVKKIRRNEFFFGIASSLVLWPYNLTDISASPRNNGSRLPTSLRRQKRADAWNATKISEDEFAFAILPFYNKYYSAFPEHSLNYYTNSYQYSQYFMLHIMPKLLKSANTSISTH